MTTNEVSTLVGAPSREVAAVLASLDWDFADADTLHNGHGVQSYPAKFPPQLPHQVIDLLSEHGELVLDCFGGSGTTALEAIRAGRSAYSIDANAVGVLLTKIKTTPLSTSDRDQLLDAADAVLQPLPQSAELGDAAFRPVIPNVDRWYAPHVVEELVACRWVLTSTIDSPVALNAALAAFAQAAARMSYQDSETRYRATPRDIARGDASRRVSKELERLLQVLPDQEAQACTSVAVTGDARDASMYPGGQSVGLVVTSPPYPNAYDYHLYHRFRLFWLAEDPRDLRSVEIGSHLRNQNKRDPVGDYESDLTAVLQNVSAALVPGRFAVFVVGTGLHKGELYDTASRLAVVAASTGLDHVVTLERRLPTHRRAVTVAGRRLGAEQIVVLRRPTG